MEGKIGLFITRCQPGFHDGHIDSINEAINAGMDRIIIGVGSADKEFTKDNPFTYDERKKMIELSLKEFIPNLGIAIYPIPHSNDGEQRKNYILKNLPKFDYIISSNPMVREGFKDANKLFFQTSITTNTRASVIRNKISMGDYQYLYQVLSKKVVEYLKNIKAFERLRDIFKDERVTPNIVTDSVFCDKEGRLVLIQRKNHPQGIALPGGFVNYGESTEEACIRKAKEETGADIKIIRLVGIYDNLSRDPRDHNISAVYLGKLVGNETDRSSGNKKVLKVDLEKIDEIDFAFPDHKKMILDAFRYHND
ncbi:MAG: NUDIX domain-containing protein [Candidatus Absconditicoccaceae bacterium]